MDQDKAYQCDEESLDEGIREMAHAAVSKYYSMHKSELADMSFSDTGTMLAHSAPWCMLRSVERQERLMNDMHKQSKAMIWHSRAMLVLTVVLVLLTVLLLLDASGVSLPGIYKAITCVVTR